MDLNALRPADIQARHEARTPVINPKLAEDPVFKDNRNKFFGADPEKSQSYVLRVCTPFRNWVANVSKFYPEPPPGKGFVLPSEEVKVVLVPRPSPLVENVNPESEFYQRNEKRFFGLDSRNSGRGSVYQRNAAHFYGDVTPEHGQRPYEARLPTGASERAREEPSGGV